MREKCRRLLLIFEMSGYGDTSMLVIVSIRAFILAVKIKSMWQIDLPHAYRWSYAAVQHETKEFPAEILLALTHRESNFDPQSGPHGRWPKKIIVKKRHYICGPIQTTHYSIEECLLVRDPYHGYFHGVQQLTQWGTICQRFKRKNLTKCALNGFMRGWEAALSEVDLSIKIFYDAKKLQSPLGKK